MALSPPPAVVDKRFNFSIPLLAKEKVLARLSAGFPDPTAGGVAMSEDFVESAQEAAERDARENGELLALARRAAKAGTFDLDVRNGISRFCPRSLEILGHAPDRAPELTAAEWAEHIFPGDAERVLREGRAARDSRTDLITEYRIVKADGEIRWVRGLGRTLLDAGGEAVRCVGFNFDVTEEKRAEDRMRRMQAELVRASRGNAMGTMAEALAHELNQPLTALSNYLSGARKLLNGLPESQTRPVHEAFDLALRAAHRAGEIMRGLRMLTRRRTGDSTALPLDRIIREALGLVLAGTDELGIEKSIDLAPDLVVDVNDLQVQQVVISLAGNAIEAMEDCSPKVLSISCTRDGGRAVVRVEDSGMGVPEDDRPNLLEPFAATRPSRIGLGIGLAIARTIVEAHGGKLWAEHREVGTAICFTLPLVDRARRA